MTEQGHITARIERGKENDNMVYVAFMPGCGCPIWAGVANDPKHHLMVEEDRAEFERLGYRIELMEEQPLLRCEHHDLS